MAARSLSLTPKVLTLVLLASMTGLVYQGFRLPEGDGASGRIVPMVYATELETQEKDVGDYVHFKVKIKNTGNVEATFVVYVYWSEDGLGEWEPNGLEDVRLGPDQYETLVVGSVECSEAMMGRFFDVKFVLYDAEADAVLDEKIIERAWYVSEVIVSGNIVSFWVE